MLKIYFWLIIKVSLFIWLINTKWNYNCRRFWIKDIKSIWSYIFLTLIRVKKIPKIVFWFFFFLYNLRIIINLHSSLIISRAYLLFTFLSFLALFAFFLHSAQSWVIGRKSFGVKFLSFILSIVFYFISLLLLFSFYCLFLFF